MLQNPFKTLGFKKNMVFEVSPEGGGKPYLASGQKVAPATTIYEFGRLKYGILSHISVFLRNITETVMYKIAQTTDIFR